MASIEQQRWQRFAWNATRYALGPIGGLLVPWLVISRSDAGAWGEALSTIIPMQIMLHVAAFGSKELLLRTFALSTSRDPRSWAVESLITRASAMLPIAALLAFTSATIWWWAALWFFSSFCSTAFDPVFIWRKNFLTLLVADALGLIVQVLFVVSTGYPNEETIVLSFMMNAVSRLGVIAIVVRSWSPIHDPLDAFHLSYNSHFIHALPFFLIGFSGLLASRIDLYTANALLDRAEVGRYQIVASLFIQFQALAALVVAPLTKDLYRLNLESVARYTRRMRIWALAGLLPMCAVAWAVFTFLFKFELSWGAYASACALVWPVFAYVPVINQLYKHHRERSVMWANFAAAALTCGLTFVLLPKLGIAGGLLAAAAGQWLVLAWMKREEHRLHALPRM